MQPLINLMRDRLLEADIVYGVDKTAQVLKSQAAPLNAGGICGRR
ncbi:hypothetical protein QZN17_28010 [Burkholderia multivorans]|nr:hypothetical protein [Burkholderia multivorans]MDN8032412.1 hypothetical protein [Burkholderia multivorans]